MNTRTSPEPALAPSPLPHAEFFPPPRAPIHPFRWVGGVIDDLRELVRFWPVVQNMVVQDLRVKYQRSVLGFFWTLLNPILMMATFTVVFANLLMRGARWQDYSIHLFSGMIPWMLLAGSLTECAFCIISNESLIRKIYIPKLVFPVSRVVINLITFLLSLVAMFALLIPIGARPSWPMVLLPVAIVLFAVFALGLGILLGTINTFFRDTSHLIGVFLQAWYFVTPILFSEEQVMANKPWLLWLNPAYPFIRIFQRIIEDHAWPSPYLFCAAAGIAAVSLGVGYAAFKANEDKLVFRL